MSGMRQYCSIACSAIILCVLALGFAGAPSRVPGFPMIERGNTNLAKTLGVAPEVIEGFNSVLTDSGMVQDWHWENPFPEGNHLLSVTTSPNGNVYAAGFLGTIDVSTDLGITWTTLHSIEGVGALSVLTSVQMVDNSIGFAAGGNGTILATTDGGNSWTKMSFPSSFGILGLSFVDASNGWASVSTAVVYATTNGGTSWTTEFLPTTGQVNSVSFANSTTGWAVTSEGEILTTGDGGNTWTAQLNDTAASFSYVQFISPTAGWAVSGDSVFRTGNGGTTWTGATAPGAYRTITMLNDGL